MHRPQTPQLGFGSITLLQKLTPHFKILDPRLHFHQLYKPAGSVDQLWINGSVVLDQTSYFILYQEEKIFVYSMAHV